MSRRTSSNGFCKLLLTYYIIGLPIGDLAYQFPDRFVPACGAKLTAVLSKTGTRRSMEPISYAFPGDAVTFVGIPLALLVAAGDADRLLCDMSSALLKSNLSLSLRMVHSSLSLPPTIMIDSPWTPGRVANIGAFTSAAQSVVPLLVIAGSEARAGIGHGSCTGPWARARRSVRKYGGHSRQRGLALPGWAYE